MQIQHNPAHWHVLVVDDNDENRDSLALVLDYFEATVIEAESGLKALQLLDEHPEVNLCLLDIKMAELSGWQVLGEIRNHAQKTIRNLPVIAVTVLSTAQERREIVESGFDGHLVKPYSVATLIQDINQILTAYQVKRAGT